MRRVPTELLVGPGASALIALAVLAVGGGLRASPIPLPSRLVEQAGCWDTRLVALDRSGIVGHARLCAPDEGVRAGMAAEGLTSGVAYTAWLVYFDRPSECRVARCAVDDLLGEEPVGIIGRMDGTVANGTRKAEFAGDFRDLRASSTSQVILLLFERGQAGSPDSRRRARQLLSLHVGRPNGLPAGAPDDGARLVAQAIFDLP